MAFPDTQEAHTNVSDNVTQLVAEHVNWGYGVIPRIEDRLGYSTDTANANGSVTAQILDLQEQLVGSSFPTEIASATHGPVTLVITDTTGHNIVAAPGTGLSVYITSIAAWNEDTMAARLTATDGVVSWRARLAATDGAGFVHAFDPPWECPENTAFTVTMGTAITSVLVDINFYVAEPTV